MKDPLSLNIVIADDTSIYRKAILFLLSTTPNFKVVAETEDGMAAVEAVEKHRPDVVLMDIRMPILDGIKATKVITNNYPDVKVIILTIYDESQVIEHARKAGAVDCICKDCSAEEIIQAIKQAGT